MSGSRVLMRQYSNNIIERYILIDDQHMTDNEKDVFVSKINQELWLAIQETNAFVKGRVLPFVIVRRVIKDDSKIRVIINDLSIDDFQPVSNYAETKEINIEDVSHIITFKSITPQNIIRVSDDLKPGTAEVWTDRNNQIAAAVDIFLDIAMFNSFSYFRDKLDLNNKKEFNQLKYEYFKKSNYESYYFIEEKSPPSYISFSFAFRTSVNELDYYAYYLCWEDFVNSSFINSAYPNMECIIDRPEIQMKKHKNPDQLPKECFTSKYWTEYENGDYLFLRITGSPNNESRKNRLKSYFGITTFHIGPTKVVPNDEYFKPFIIQDINEGNISAFKVVVHK